MIKYFGQNWRSHTKQCCSQRLEALGPAAHKMNKVGSLKVANQLLFDKKIKNVNPFISIFANHTGVNL